MTELTKPTVDVEIELDGKAYTLRADFGVLVRIEKRLETSIFAFLRGVALTRDVSINHIATIIAEGMRGGGRKVPEPELLGRLLFEEGIEAMSAVAIEFLSGALLGPKKAADLADG